MFRFKIIIANVMFDYLAVKSYFNKWTKLSIGIDFGIGIDQNSWYRTGIVSKPKKLVSPITTIRTSYPPRSPHHGWGRSMYWRFHALSPFALLIPYSHQPKGALFMGTKLTMPGKPCKPLCGE